MGVLATGARVGTSENQCTRSQRSGVFMSDFINKKNEKCEQTRMEVVRSVAYILQSKAIRMP